MIAAGISRVLYAETSLVTGDLTGAALKTIIDAAVTAGHEVENIHGETWNLEESEPNVTRYKNQLTGQNYRQDTVMGDIQASFTIGKYDYQTKANLMGGEIIKNGSEIVGWKRAAGAVEIYKCLICKTDDDQWCVFPKAAVVTRETNADKAIGLAVAGTAMEPDAEGARSEYWFDGSEVK
ncbi:hypothetical protein [Bacteroides sp. 51]|uniref:hypothetical protein n=1 Tax=Bacteroides sp. 51 TaxID=2302938 RepID=UPI0013CF6784|nr:hypothetical protein [Bacteroides sp. 51]NDV84887.1 hypothetical protein [Bacteroides sp. 51]